MTAEALLAFNIALIAALASPGPAMLVAVRISLSEGLRGGIAAGAGLAAMASLWTTLALLGLEGVFHLVPWAYTGLRVCGGLYLIWLAWRMWTRASSGPTATPVGGDLAGRADSARSCVRAARTGFLVNLANPKSVLFAGAVIAVVFPPGLSPLAQAVVVANHFVVELVVYAALASALSHPGLRRRYRAAGRWVDRGAAAVLGALGLRLLAGARP